VLLLAQSILPHIRFSIPELSGIPEVTGILKIPGANIPKETEKKWFHFVKA